MAMMGLNIKPHPSKHKEPIIMFDSFINQQLIYLNRTFDNIQFTEKIMKIMSN